MNREPMVRVDGVSRHFDVSRPWLTRLLAGESRRSLRAVEDVSFAIRRARTFGLVGESGSGKTTVARMVVGLLRPSSGRIRIDDVSLTGNDNPAERQALRRLIHMIFQDPYASLNPRWRIERIIAEPIRAFGLVGSPDEVGDRVDELLTLVGLHPGDRFRFPHEFSGGQRQRVAIARALASSAELLVCDEPTSALDVSVQAQILNLMRDLQDRFRLTYLLISHDLAVIRHMADHVAVMYLGRIVELGDSRALFRAPRHPYTRMLLDAVPDVSTRGRPDAEVAGEIPSPIDPPPGCAFHPRCPLVHDRCRRELPPLVDGVACHAVHDGPGTGSGGASRAGSPDGAAAPAG